MANKKLKKSLKKYDKSKQNKETLISGELGITLGGRRLVEVPGRQGFVYVRLKGNTSELIQAYNATVSPVYDLPVFVVRQTGIYKVVGRNIERHQNQWGSAPFLPKHGGQHSFNHEIGAGGDVVWTYSQQFMPLLSYPSGTQGSMTLSLSPAFYEWEGSFRYAQITGSPDYTPLLPTITGSARMVLSYLDPIDNSIKLVPGTPFSNSITGAAQIAQYIPDIPRSIGLPLAAVRLVTGTTQINWNAVYDVRDFFTVHVSSGTSSGGGGGGGIGFVGQDEGVYLATGTVLNVTGAGATLSVSGTVFNLNVPGGGGGGAGVMVWDEGQPLSTGTILNVVGDELYISVSGSVAQINMSGTYADGRYIGAYNYGTPNYQIGLVKSRDLRDWKIVKEPILSLGAGGTWDDVHLRCPRLVKVNGVLYLYYEGQDGTEWKIGLARSFDSGETWTKYTSNPILSAAGGWESTTAAEVTRPLVYYDEDDLNPSARWKMWYAGGQFGAGGIGYAYSSDGLSWTKWDGNPVLTGSAGQWDDDYLDTGGIIKRSDGTWLLFYDGKNGNFWKGGFATFRSPTGTYTKSPNNPILSGDGITTSITSNVGVGDVMISVTNANLFPVGAKVWVYDNSQRYMATVRKIVSSTVLEMYEPAPDAIASASGNVETITSGSVDFQTAIYDDGYLFSVVAHQPLSSPAGLFETSVLGYAKDSLDEVKIDYGAGLLVPITLEESRASALSKENLGILDTWEISSRQSPVLTGTSSSGAGILGVVAWDEGVLLGTGTVFNFVGSNVEATISGSVVRVSVTDAGGGGYDEGTSFPVGPSTDDKFYRTDRNLLYYYDGTRWLSTEVFRETFFPSDNTNPTTTHGASLGAWPVRQGDNGIYVLTVDAVTLVVTTNDGSNYWTISYNWRNQANSSTELVNTNTSADTATNWYNKSTSVNAVLDSTARYLNIVVNKTNAPGSIYVYPAIRYRLIG
jgi:predicted GH43/DUF377 family glycosyl hydrolase